MFSNPIHDCIKYVINYILTVSNVSFSSLFLPFLLFLLYFFLSHFFSRKEIDFERDCFPDSIRRLNWMTFFDFIQFFPFPLFAPKERNDKNSLFLLFLFLLLFSSSFPSLLILLLLFFSWIIFFSSLGFFLLLLLLDSFPSSPSPSLEGDSLIHKLLDNPWRKRQWPVLVTHLSSSVHHLSSSVHTRKVTLCPLSGHSLLLLPDHLTFLSVSFPFIFFYFLSLCFFSSFPFPLPSISCLDTIPVVVCWWVQVTSHTNSRTLSWRKDGPGWRNGEEVREKERK